MTEKLYKAVRPNGRDFHTDSVQWAPEKTKARKGRLVKHPTAAEVGGNASAYLSVSVDPTDLPGASWPMRLLVVEPVGEVVAPEPERMQNKRAAVAFRVVEEIDPSARFGPQGREVAALIDRAGRLTATEARSLDAAWSASWDAAWYAAWALVVRDLIGSHGFTQQHYDTLSGPWRKAVGPIHADDEALS